MFALEALEKRTQLTLLLQECQACVGNSLLDMFYQSVGSALHSAAGSWGGNTKAGSARKINNPGETKDGCLVEAGHPGGRNRWGGSGLK